MRKLHGQLQNTKGKKVYGYLQKDTKRTVDEVFFRLSQNESIQKMYRLWCGMEQSKHDFYSSAKVDFPAIVDNEQFKSVKNIIVKAVGELNVDIAVEESISSSAEINAITDETASSSDVESIELRTVEHEPIADEPAKSDSEALANAALGLLVSLSSIISDDYNRNHRKISSRIDKELRRMIDRKKLEIGLH